MKTISFLVTLFCLALFSHYAAKAEDSVSEEAGNEKSVKEEAKDLGRAVKREAKEAGRKLKKTAKKVKAAAKEAGQDLKATAKKTKKKITD